MSREIKFRLWDKKNQQMIDCDGLKAIGIFALQEGLSPEDFLILPTTDDIILMQFTGLHDKNGKEIYEGDIVNCIDTNPAIFEVKFIEGGFCCTSNNILPFDINSFYPSIGCRIEVIGNIYENPELMGGIK